MPTRHSQEEQTGAHVVQPRDPNQPGRENPGAYHGSGKHSSKNKLIAWGTGIALVGSLATYGAIQLKHQYDKTENLKGENEAKIAKGNADKLSFIEDLHKSGKHTATLGGVVVLMQGTKIRSSTAQANEKLFGHVPGNVTHTVGEDEVVLFTNPIITNEGANWIRATDYVAPATGDTFNEGSASALAKATEFVNITGTLDQGAATVCQQDKDSYATVTDKYGYAGPDGKQTAFVTTMPAETFAGMLASGAMVCTEKPTLP